MVSEIEVYAKQIYGTFNQNKHDDEPVNLGVMA